MHGMLIVDGTMKNKTVENYSMVAFSIEFFYVGEDVIAERIFGITDFLHGEEGVIHAAIIPQGELDFDNLIYEIKVEQFL